MKMTIITKVMIWLVSEKQWVHSGGKEKHRGEVSKPEYRYKYKYTNMNHKYEYRYKYKFTNMNYKYNSLMSLINFLPSGADGTDCSDRNRGLQVEVGVYMIQRRWRWFHRESSQQSWNISDFISIINITENHWWRILETWGSARSPDLFEPAMMPAKNNVNDAAVSAQTSNTNIHTKCHFLEHGWS